MAGQDRVKSLAELLVIRKELLSRGEVVVFTNGCFDLLHLGHVRYLQQARTLGDCLVVGINSDASLRRLKGHNRPLQTQEDRAEILAALSCVDYVMVFSEDTAEQTVEALKPDVYVKGGDYAVDNPQDLARQLPEAAVVQSYGGQVTLLPFLPGRSTSDLVKRIMLDSQRDSQG